MKYDFKIRYHMSSFDPENLEPFIHEEFCGCYLNQLLARKQLRIN